jgi:hypothetical protein
MTHETIQLGGAAVIMPLALTTPMNLPVWFTYDPDAGTFTINGTLTTAPLWRRVNLIDEFTGRVLREVWSDPQTGAYSFPNMLGGRKYTVVAYDSFGQARALIADGLEATP